MKNEEVKEQEVLNEVEEEVKEINKAHEMQETAVTTVQGFDKPSVQAGTRQYINSTISDPKVLFNLNDHIDHKLNDFEGKEINLVDVVVKSYERDIPERLNEFTGELETIDRSIVTIILDDTGTSYVTASKMFAMRVIELVRTFGIENVHKGIKIRITKTPHKNGNKKLGFEIL